VTPAIMNSTCEGDVHKGSPFRPLRLLKQLHPGLVRKAISLPRVARDAGADNIFPCGLSPAVTWQDVVNVEIRPVEVMSTILAGVFVPLKDVVASELDLLFGKSVKEAEHDDSRDPDL